MSRRRTASEIRDDNSWLAADAQERHPGWIIRWSGEFRGTWVAMANYGPLFLGRQLTAPSLAELEMEISRDERLRGRP